MNAERVTTHTDHELTDDEYEEIINEICEEVKIGSLTYSPGRVLREMDPAAFRCGKADMQKWECGECGKVYDEEDDAAECCPKWKCGECGEEYDDEVEAEECCQLTEEDKEEAARERLEDR